MPAPKFLRATATGGTSIDLAWEPPEGGMGEPITHYQVCVIDENGVTLPFEDTAGPETRWQIRGLALGHTYGFRVRAATANGVGPPTAILYATVTPSTATVVPPGQRLPLLDVDRQSLIVRVAEIECRVGVWWHPSDKAWYGALEVPTNTPVVQGRRLATNAGLLDRIPGVLPGNLVCRELGGEGEEPARDAWRNPTHGLVWEVD